MRVLPGLCSLCIACASLSGRAFSEKVPDSCNGRSWNSTEDASLLQSQSQHLRRGVKKKHPFHLDRHTHHHAKVVDTADYRADAAAFFAKVKDLPVEERCPELKRMTLDQVHQQWHKYLAETDNNARKLSGKKKQEAFYDLHFSFNDMLAETPVLVTGHVPKQLGWQAATHWGKDELAKRMGSLPWQKFTFNYPDWLIGMEQWESLDDYVSHNESSQNIFLFASEGGCKEEDAKLKHSVDAIREQFAPSPEFAFGPEECMAIVAIDALGSSHGFHSHDPVWNVQVEGHKMWWLLPPNYKSSDNWPEGGQRWGAAPLLPDGSAFRYPNACAMLNQATPPPGTLTCVTAPGEMLLLPDEWIHATCGITDFTAAAGGWLAYHTD